MIKFILTMVGCLVIAYLMGGFDQLAYSFRTREMKIQYLCSKSGVEYMQTIRGLTVHLYGNGQPVKCDRWKSYEQRRAI